MKCYNHNEVDATAICKSCHKALCSECLVEVDNGIACKGKCEDEVTYLNQVMQNNKKIIKNNGKALINSSIFYGIAGLAFIYFAFTIDLPEIEPFLAVLGILMLFAGLLALKNSIIYRKK